jgi:hypothetical protein
MVRISIGTGIPSFEKYDFTYGLSTLLRSIIFIPDLDERIKRNIDKSKKGVVGKIGMKAPIRPSTTHRFATSRYIIFLIIVDWSSRSLN